MNKVKKLILSATIFILTICSTSVVFGTNQVSWNDFCNWVNENLEIDISSYTTCGMQQYYWQQFKDYFVNSNGFYIYENNNGEIRTGVNNRTFNGTIYFVFNKDEIPYQKIKVENQSYNFYSPDSDSNTNTYCYIFNKDTKKFVEQSYNAYVNTGWFKWVMNDNDSVANFYSEENSKYVLHNQILCASNYTFIVQNLQNNYNWEYELTIEEMTTTPFPWGEIGTGGGDNIIYDYTNENLKTKYFKPYLEFNAPINGYVDYTGNWDKGTTWEIDNTTYKDNEFYLYVYSGEGSEDENLYRGHIYLDVLKAEYTTNIETNKEEIKYKYYDTKRCSPGAVYNYGEEISENVMKFTFTLKRCFNNVTESDRDWNTGWLNDLSGDKDYIFILRFEDVFGDTTSNTNPFYFNKESPLNKYENNLPVQNPILNGYGYGSGGGFRDSNGQQIIDESNQDLINLNTSSFSKLLTSSKQFISNFLSFFDIFPTWLNSLIALALTVAIVCRVIGR